MKDFEFDALDNATNYRRSLIREFSGSLRGDVLEVGAGIGQMTECILDFSEAKSVLSLEPNADFCRIHRERFPRHDLLHGTSSDLPLDRSWDAIVSINVLEHIADDESELGRYVALLRPRKGHLCLFVPARPELFAPIDADFGHFRRYTQTELRNKLERFNFTIQRLCYFNLCGYPLWWFTFVVLKRRSFNPRMVRLFDRTIFPVAHFLESHLVRPPIGQSLLAVATA